MIKKNHNRRGATIVLIVIMLPILFTLSAMAISLSYTQLIRTELQIATDLSGRAAGRVYALTADRDQAFNAARIVAAHNTIGGEPFVINRADLVFGTAQRTSTSERYSFTESSISNSVQLTTDPIASGISATPFFSGFSPSTRLSPTKSAISTIIELDIALVIDRSGSMAYASNEVAGNSSAPSAAPAGWSFGEPVPPNARWLDTVAAVQVFVDELDRTPQTERVALVTYNQDPVINVAATENYTAILAGLHNYSLAFHGGGTSIGGGINQGLTALADPVNTRPWASKAVILMTDGMHNVGTNPTEAANLSASQGVIVFTVTFSQEANRTLMQDVASITSGRHYHADDAAQLRDAFSDIARQLPTLLTR